METNPPVIPATSTTPADEWASSTTSALDAQQRSDPGAPSTSNEPGRQAQSDISTSAPTTTEESKKAAQGVLDSARQYLPAQKGVQSAFHSATETAKQYLPESVASYLPASSGDDKNSPLPSKEVPGGSRVGVGSLPGNLSEASVAKLPEERAMEGSLPSTKNATAAAPPHTAHLATFKYSMPSTETPSGSYGGVGSLPGNYSEVSVAKLPEERRQEVLPSHETDHEVLGKTGGVGALPGGPDESRVALLPEERAHSEEEIYKSSTGGMRARTPAGLGLAAGTAAAAKPTPAPTDQRESKTERLKEEAKAAKAKVTTGPPSGTEYHPATLHPDTLSTARTTSETSDTAAISSTGDRRASTGSMGEHKVGFMEKMKGEAKVISGKLAHNEKKVEAGKHMMGK
ncbi:hypothetical protein D9615_007080 [Tricholomella constricta]|uniref:Uncharacterized protein n=1 Tax=Tricholomella constricta TaxID=117010 RepID=A0A8H5H847_9AGAR|nr:hypothetical protein D9615_007080 [Tricholomella constricta]